MIVQSIEVCITSYLLMDFRLYMQTDILPILFPCRLLATVWLMKITMWKWLTTPLLSTQALANHHEQWYLLNGLLQSSLCSNQCSPPSQMSGRLVRHYLVSGFIPQPQGSWGLVLWNFSLILRSSHCTDFEWRGRPGPFYHVHDANVYLLVDR